MPGVPTPCPGARQRVMAGARGCVAVAVLQGLTPGPQQWSEARLCGRAGIPVAFPIPVHSLPEDGGALRPRAVPWGCSWGLFPPPAPRLFPSTQALGDKGSSCPRGKAAPALPWLVGKMGDSRATPSPAPSRETRETAAPVVGFTDNPGPDGDSSHRLASLGLGSHQGPSLC